LTHVTAGIFEKLGQVYRSMKADMQAELEKPESCHTFSQL